MTLISKASGLSASPFRRPINRRKLNQYLASSGLALTTLPLVGRAHADECGDDYPLSFAWIGSETPEYNASFVDKYSCVPNYTFFADQGEALAKLNSGFTADILTPCANWVQRFYDAGLLAPIETGRLQYFDDLIPALRDVDGAVIDGERYFVPIDWGQVSVIYRQDLAPEYVDNETWGILWDPKYAGRIAYRDTVDEAIAIAAAYRGIDPYSMDDNDVAEVREALTELMPNLLTYSVDATSLQQMVASGEVVAAVGFGYSVTPLKNEGLPVGFMDPKEGALTWVCGVTRLKANAGKDEAMVQKAHDVIDGYIGPETGVYEITEWGYGHSNAKAYGLVDPAVLEELNIPQDPSTYLGNALFQKPLPNTNELQNMWDEVKAGF